MQRFNPADYVRVVNNDEQSVERGKKLIRGRFDGEDYVFPLGRPVDIPIVAAAHIFGFGRKDKSQALLRLGWARTSDELDNGLDRLKKIAFSDMPAMMEVPKESEAVLETPGTSAVVESGEGQKPSSDKTPPKGKRSEAL